MACSGRLGDSQGSDFFDLPGSESASRTVSTSDSESSKAAVWVDPQPDQDASGVDLVLVTLRGSGGEEGRGEVYVLRDRGQTRVSVDSTLTLRVNLLVSHCLYHWEILLRCVGYGIGIGISM